MTTHNETTTLTQKLMDVRKEAGHYMRKDAQVDIKNRKAYGYVSHGAVMAKIAPLFDKHGILMTSEVKNVIRSQIKSGEQVCTIQQSFTIINAENPEDRIVLEHWSEGADPRDKAIAKAITAGQRQIIQQLMMLASGDDPEKGDEEAAAREIQAQHAAAAKEARRARGNAQLMARAEAWDTNADWTDDKERAGAYLTHHGFVARPLSDEDWIRLEAIWDQEDAAVAALN